MTNKQEDLPFDDKLPDIEAEVGISSDMAKKSGKAWSGDLIGTGGTVNMQNGNLSNVPNPFIAIDVECLVYVPDQYVKKVKILEALPFTKNKAIKYYREVPGAMRRMCELMRYSYNIEVVFVGKKNMLEQRQELVKKFPFTHFLFIGNATEFWSELASDDRVIHYYTLSEYRCKNSNHKGVLFQDWSQSFGLEKK